MDEATSTHPEPVAHTWHEIEGLVDELTGLSKSDIAARDFYAELLDRAVRGLAAQAGAVWINSADGQIKLACQVRFDRAVKDSFRRGEHQTHDELLTHVLQLGESKTFAPHATLGSDAEAANPTDYLLALCPIVVDDDPVAVVEIVQQPGASPATQRSYLQVLTVMCELAADFHRNRELRVLRDRAAHWSQFDDFARRVHADLNLDAVAYTIANEARRLIDCDRVSVAVARGRKCRLRAISGVDLIDRRATQVRQLETLMNSVVRIGEQVWYTGRWPDLPPQIESALRSYVDTSHARVVAVLPLTSDPSASDKSVVRAHNVGVLVAEHFTADCDVETFESRVNAVARHSDLALGNALAMRRFTSIPLVSLLAGASSFVRSRRSLVAILLLLVVAALALAAVLVPAEFTVEGRGELQPTRKQVVYAPRDGVVKSLPLADRMDAAADSKQDIPVEQDTELIVLENTDLEYEITTVLGEKQTAEKELNTVSVSRVAARRPGAGQGDKYDELTAKEEELKVRIAGLDERLKILRQQRDELTVHSELDGRLMTWDVRQLLESRPVRRGQKLMVVVDPSSDWVVEMHVPDKHIRYVFEAQQEQGDELPVSFILKSDPGVTYAGRIKKVALATESEDELNATVLVTVAFDREQVPKSLLRPGTTVAAKIDCGYQPIGFVWLHDLIEAVRIRLLF